MFRQRQFFVQNLQRLCILPKQRAREYPCGICHDSLLNDSADTAALLRQRRLILLINNL